MDPIVNRDNLFSRGPSPPPPSQHFQVPPAQHNEPHVSPAPSHREVAQTTAQSHLDSLLHGLNTPSASHVSPQPSVASAGIYHGPQEPPHSGPATPASGHAGSISSNVSGPTNQSHDRQNALLTLLGTVASPSSNPQPMLPAGPPAPQQVPTPPGSAPRQGMLSSESQGKLLLEQLMSGGSKYAQQEQQQQPMSHPPSGASPPYVPLPPDQSHSDEYAVPPEATYSHERDTSSHLAAAAVEPRPASPARKSIFDFVSPFDALTGAANTGAKRKPPPVQPNDEPPSWSQMSVDPKRKSVENLMDQLTRGQAPPSASSQQPVAPYDLYSPMQAEEPPAPETLQARAARPLPPQPSLPTGSPRSSPPKQASQAVRQQRRNADSPIGQPGAPQGPFGNNYNREKESSPLPQRGAVPDGRRGNGQKGKNPSPSAHSQLIMFDVTQPLDEIQAPLDTVKSTAIALVKVDSTFLPGTTIGATQWVAYAMTKGRVRVISRSSGDRTLLQLPPMFPPTTAVSDMSVHGNRLAGVTSDGGFVVWELPPVITDDVPGTIMLCVYPQNDLEPLHSVKWHPQQPDLVAVASDTNVYLVNIADAAHAFGGEPISQVDLHRVGQIFSVPSPIVAFDFDVPRSALATISEDSTLTMWNIRDKLPFWSHKIRGDDLPSSLTFVDGGVIVGRKKGTIFQLLPVMGRQVLSTIKFVSGDKEDPQMFGHANYDSRYQTLWIANNRRESMIAFKLHFDPSTPSPGSEDSALSAYFEQVVEFTGPKPTIHFVILTADADPHGDEAHAACVAAKVPPGELALVAFSVHSSGVDQVLIRQEWYNAALASAHARYPSYHGVIEARPPRQQPPPVSHSMQMNQVVANQSPVSVPMPRAKTPPSEEVDVEASAQEGGRGGKGKGVNKGKNVGWKDKDEREKVAQKVEPDYNSDLGSTLSKEIKKSEESLHNRLGRLIAKELDKQHFRLEEVRQSEQAADFARQEKILKLISTELTKNTTRVVEMAVKNEVQNSVLPSLENITKTEVKAALSNQIAKGVSDAMKTALPNEIERVLIRPEMATQVARAFSSNVMPVVERQIKESLAKNMVPQTALHQELSREVRSEILNLKKEVLTWQSDALRGQESLIRELEQSVRMLSEQVKFLSMNSSSSNFGHPMQNRSSPGPSSSSSMLPPTQLSQLLRQPNLQPPPMNQQSGYQQHTFQQPPPQQQQQQPMHGPWFGPNIVAPQASHPTAPPPLPQQQNNMSRATPPTSGQPEEWDDAYLAVLGSQDTRQLRELLARSNPELVMPLNGPSPLSQAVMLTLVHRLSTVIGETPPVDESFKVSLWWLQRAATVLNTSDPLISPYVSRVMPNVQQMLNSTKQRLSILPGMPSSDTPRTISEIQEILNRKPMSG
ncbi:hypothetical protein TRAPUB_150 [Trametes pubescens]|uniref:Enhancer of mRNA-decapping protein 4 n=1 Tax=Trametes pubescens TaxID=154538 RepID=A0A1M2VN15_TRAPU|nr:hypothetical protein TRAPUB_150 [Trametes pubescens]